MENIIHEVQISPFDYCNSHCWFCPVRYTRPAYLPKHLDLKLIDTLFKQLVDGRGYFVSQHLHTIYTSHYNELLLYKYFEDFLDLLRKYNLYILILTNGTHFTDKNISLIKQYKDRINGICINFPAGNKYDWSEYTLFKQDHYDDVIQSIKDVIKLDVNLSIQVNGISSKSLLGYGGSIELLNNRPSIDLNIKNGCLFTNYNQLKNQFPNINIYRQDFLIDRAGILHDHQVFSNQRYIQKYLKKNKVIGCSHSANISGRPNGWLHINDNGDLFLCCNDYNFETVYGNLHEKSLQELWFSKEKQNMISYIYQEICPKCISSVWR